MLGAKNVRDASCLLGTDGNWKQHISFLFYAHAETWPI